MPVIVAKATSSTYTLGNKLHVFCKLGLTRTYCLQPDGRPSFQAIPAPRPSCVHTPASIVHGIDGDRSGTHTGPALRPEARPPSLSPYAINSSSPALIFDTCD